MKAVSKLKTLKRQAPAPDVERGGLRERKKARLREQITSTALALYRARGYEGTTVEEICRSVEISQPTFYNYFPSKESILAEHAMLGFGAPLRVLLGEHNDANLEARLTRYFREVARVMTRDKKLWHAIAVSGAYNPVRNPSLLRAAAAGTHVLVQVLEQGQKSGELTRTFSAEKLASMLEGIMLRTGIEWGAGYGEGTLEARMSEALRFFMRAAKK
jgi:AcrR family transcriptional regulator